jgi:protein TonB
MMNRGEKFDRWLVLSVTLHAIFFAVVLASPVLFPMSGHATWGSATAGNGGIDVKIVSSISGIALPSPEIVRDDAPANESKGFYKSDPEPTPPPPPENAEPIPETKAPVKAPPQPKPAPPPSRPAKTKETPPAPANAVPYGEGGRPSLAYGQFQSGSGSMGVGFGDGAFGTQYGWYVQAMTRRISQNWLRALVDSRLTRAPRVYVHFDILRDGRIQSAEIQQSSGIPTLDNSALRAILASSPLDKLPADYRGSEVSVSFYFEYTK